VERLHETERALHESDLDAHRHADLRRAQVEAANATLLHELYFNGLAATRVEPSRYIRGHMSEHMGAWEAVWLGANPLVVCDVSSHAQAKDYQRREDYVAKFLEHVDWDEIARRYRAVDRM